MSGFFNAIEKLVNALGPARRLTDEEQLYVPEQVVEVGGACSGTSSPRPVDSDGSDAGEDAYGQRGTGHRMRRAMGGPWIPRSDWLNHLFGGDVAEAIANLPQLLTVDRRKVQIVNRTPGHEESYGAGCITSLRTGEVRAAFTDPAVRTTELHVYMPGDTSDATSRRLSPATAQCDPANNGAMFLVETGFDALPRDLERSEEEEDEDEDCGKDRPTIATMEHRLRLAGQSDACVSVAAATALRALAPRYGNAGVTGSGSYKPMSMVADPVLVAHFGPRAVPATVRGFPASDSPEYAAMLGVFGMIYQTGCQVMYTGPVGLGGALAIAPARQFVDQVFGAVLPPDEARRRPAEQAFLLDAVYSTAYLAAIREHKTVLFLCLVGTDGAAALAALVRTHTRYTQLTYCELQQVIVLAQLRQPAVDTDRILRDVSATCPVTKYITVQGIDYVAFQVAPEPVGTSEKF